MCVILILNENDCNDQFGANNIFSNIILGCVDPSLHTTWNEIFSSNYFMVRFCRDVREVELCGALKVFYLYF